MPGVTQFNGRRFSNLWRLVAVTRVLIADGANADLGYVKAECYLKYQGTLKIPG